MFKKEEGNKKKAVCSDTCQQNDVDKILAPCSVAREPWKETDDALCQTKLSELGHQNGSILNCAHDTNLLDRQETRVEVEQVDVADNNPDVRYDGSNDALPDDQAHGGAYLPSK